MPLNSLHYLFVLLIHFLICIEIVKNQNLADSFLDDLNNFLNELTGNKEDDTDRESDEDHNINHCGLNRFDENYDYKRSDSMSYNKRIVGGSTSKIGEWPWAVSLNYVHNSTFYHLCGGTLINKQWVISAAHCFEHDQELPGLNETSSWMVILGEHNIENKSKFRQVVSLEKIIFHPLRERGINDYDVVLIKLDRSVKFSRDVNVACLPESHDDPPAGVPCYVAGWGYKAEGGDVSKTLQHLKVIIISEKECKKDYKVLPEEYKNISISVTDSMFCAGYHGGGKDSCQADSGGPLMCKKYNQWTITGVISFGIGCGRKGYPGIYSRVSRYVYWIKSTIRKN